VRSTATWSFDDSAVALAKLCPRSLRAALRLYGRSAEHEKVVAFCGGQLNMRIGKICGVSLLALIAAIPATAQSITQQLVPQTVQVGQTATFTIGFTGGTCRTAWYVSGTLHYGAYAPSPISYSLQNVTLAQNGATVQVKLYGCSGGTDAVTSNKVVLTVVSTGATLQSISVAPASPSVFVGGTQQLSATGSYSDGSMQNLTPTATWSSSALDVATVTGGLAKGIAPGQATISAASGTVTGSVTLMVNSVVVPPTVTTQPTSQTVTAGQTGTFTVAATGTAPLHYQWYKNGAAISQANSTSYTTPATSSSDNGSVFQVVVSNSAGSVTSNSATLTVTSGPSIASATINAGSPGRAVAADFGGIALGNIQDANDLIGTAAEPNPIYRQLIRNLMFPNQQFMITAEDDGTFAAPTGAQVSVLGQLYRDMQAGGYTVKIIPGVPLCPDNLETAEAYASSYISNMPSGSMIGMTLGNEPDQYPLAGNGCRSTSYAYANFLTDFQSWVTGIRGVSGGNGIKFLAPQFSGNWTNVSLRTFIGSEASVIAIVGQHKYALNGCGNTPTIAQMLAPSAVTSMTAFLSPYVSTAHGANLTYRVSEMNSIDCSGTTGVSDSFASALWLPDQMFSIANAGIDGVNIFSDEGDVYDLFGFNSTTFPLSCTFNFTSGCFIRPEYYGFLIFQEATQNHAALLPVTTTTSANVSIWATIDASGVVRVLVINKDQSASGNVNITLSGFGNGILSRLVAPSVSSETGVTWAGQTFDGSSDGRIQGTESTATVVPNSNMYTFSIAPTSAALLTVSRP
jgi:hypothetical protein